jgi:cytochrome P450
MTGDTGFGVSDDWCAHHFDHLSPALASNLHDVLTHMRASHPVAHSDTHDGFWVVTRYADVLGVAQDWETFSSAHGVSPGVSTMTVKAIPEHVDPPLHRAYKRVINAWFTPAIVGRHEDATRRIVNQLIDAFVDRGECDFMADFARPFPGLTFFELVLGAPPDEAAMVNALATTATDPTNHDSKAAWQEMFEWISGFVDRRRLGPRRDDVVDAVLYAEIEGRPITEEEVIGIVQLLILGGLDTTAGALGSMMIRFCREPEVWALLRERPERIPDAVEELLRLDSSFIAIARTATGDTEVGGQKIGAGEKVLIYWASANRDDDEFACPHQFEPDRERNRHLAFGAGPHRCAGSHVARMNLRIALEELSRRLDRVQLQDGADIRFHSALNRSPLTVPITFTTRS